MNDFGYNRIVEVFDTNETAGSFLREDGEGGFASGVKRMADEIERLRAIEDAAVIVIAGLNERIVQADPINVPVFAGIVDLHDALFGRSDKGETK